MALAQPRPRTLRARALRRDQTEVERRLWALIRSRQLDGCKFRRQHPIGRYVADFACVEARLIIELDGGQHGDPANLDADRTQALEIAGWRVVRFWNPQVVQEPQGVPRTILLELKRARP